MACLSRSEINIKRQNVRDRLDLQLKIDEANTIIKNALDKVINPVIAFSGGKDSLVVLDLVRNIKSSVVAVFENTTNEYPETLKYIKTISNLVELKPEISFKTCWSKYGMPTIKSKAKSHGNQCCIKLKEEPFLKYVEKNNIDLSFTGLTMAESRNRMMMLKRMGPLYFNKIEKIWKCHPIYNWSDQEVWQYIDFQKLKYNSIYDVLGRSSRCGCRLCTAYISWKDRTFQYNKKDTYLLARQQGFKLLSDF